jgi:hypothetical protein
LCYFEEIVVQGRGPGYNPPVYSLQCHKERRGHFTTVIKVACKIILSPHLQKPIEQG